MLFHKYINEYIFLENFCTQIYIVAHIQNVLLETMHRT